MVADKASSLIHDLNNNKVECLNAVVAKLNGGKRINFTSRMSYKSRCEAAVVSFNTRGQLLRKVHKTATSKVRNDEIF